MLRSGRHELRAVSGATTGIDLDRLVLSTAGFGPTGPVADPPAVEVGDVATVSADATIDSDGFQVIFDGKSLNGC